MIEAYAIGVTLSLKGGIGAEIAAVGRQFETLNRIIASSQMAVNELAAGMRGLERVGRNAAEAWTQAAEAMQRAARAARQAASSGLGGGGGGGGSAGAAGGARPGTALVPWSGNGFLTMPGNRGGGSFPRGPAGGPLVPYGQNGGTFAGGPGSSEGALVPYSGPGRGGMPSLSLLGSPAAPAMPGTHDLAHAAAGFGALGAALTHLVTSATTAAFDLEHETNVLRRANVDPEVIKEATAKAWETFHSVPGSFVAQNQRIFGELRSQVSSDQQALALEPAVARIGLLLQNQTGQTPQRLGQTLMRVIEMRGQAFGADGHTLDLAKVQREMDLMYKAISVSHGVITPDTFLGFQQQAGLAGMAMTPEAYYGLMPTAMQTMGGHRSGTAMTSMFSQFVGGVMTQRTAKELEKLHLLSAENVHTGRGGQVTIDPGALKGFDPQNPFTYFAGKDSRFQRAVAQHGQGADAQTALEGVLDPKIVGEMYRALGRDTTRRIIGEFISLAPTFARDQNLRNQSMASGEAEKEAANDPKMRMTQFAAALNGLMTALGGPIMDSVIGAIQSMTKVLITLGDFATAHPDVAKHIMEATIAVAGFSLAMAALSGVFLVAPAMFRLVSWLGLTGGLWALNAALSMFGVGTVSRLALAAIPDLLGAVGSAFSTLVAPITAILAALKVGSDHESPETRQRLQNLDKSRSLSPDHGFKGDGYGPDGSPLAQPQSYHPGAAGRMPAIHAHFHLDGDVFHAAVIRRVIASGSAPSHGTTGPDVRAGMFGGIGGAAFG